MFFGADAFNQDIGGWNTENVSVMGSMFIEADAFNRDIGGWNTENVVQYGATCSATPICSTRTSAAGNTSGVIKMNSMFRDTSSFNQDLSDWDTSNVTNMDSMFFGATAFDQDLSGLEIDSIASGTEASTALP